VLGVRALSAVARFDSNETRQRRLRTDRIGERAAKAAVTMTP
jgi:hypothetical protein